MKFFTKENLTSKKKLVLSSIGGLALIVLSSFILFEATKATVVLAENGEEQTVRKHSNTVEDLFKETNINVSEHDKLSHNMKEEIEDGMNVKYEKAKKLFL